MSGDFYWAKETETTSYMAVADCTGHGVPGAFMSMLGIAIIKEIINKDVDICAAKILNELRNEIKIALKQEQNLRIISDGMDISFCVINKEKKELQYAGAYRPLYVLNNNTLTEIRGDRQPISAFIKEKKFKNNTISISNKDKFYTFTDGFVDQLGGKNEKKYMTSKFKKLLQKISSHEFSEQKIILTKEFETWKGIHRQVDDILIVGFEFKN